MEILLNLGESIKLYKDGTEIKMVNFKWSLLLIYQKFQGPNFSQRVGASIFSFPQLQTTIILKFHCLDLQFPVTTKVFFEHFSLQAGRHFSSARVLPQTWKKTKDI